MFFQLTLTAGYSFVVVIFIITATERATPYYRRRTVFSPPLWYPGVSRFRPAFALLPEHSLRLCAGYALRCGRLIFLTDFVSDLRSRSIRWIAPFIFCKFFTGFFMVYVTVVDLMLGLSS